MNTDSRLIQPSQGVILNTQKIPCAIIPKANLLDSAQPISHDCPTPVMDHFPRPVDSHGGEALSQPPRSSAPIPHRRNENIEPIRPLLFGSFVHDPNNVPATNSEEISSHGNSDAAKISPDQFNPVWKTLPVNINSPQGTSQEIISEGTIKRGYLTTNIPAAFTDSRKMLLLFRLKNNRCRVFPILTYIGTPTKPTEMRILQEKTIPGSHGSRAIAFKQLQFLRDNRTGTRKWPCPTWLTRRR